MRLRDLGFGVMQGFPLQGAGAGVEQSVPEPHLTEAVMSIWMVFNETS